jgi:hypothetical protein
MPCMQRFAAIKNDSVLHPSKKIGRRSLLRLVPRCLVIAAIPLASVPGAVAAEAKANRARLPVMADVSRGNAVRIHWTPALDREMTARWRSHWSREKIASDMGVSPSAVRSRATMLDLHPRPRESLIAL